MSSEKPDEKSRVSRRNLLKGLGVGALVAGVVVGGAQEYRIINVAPPAAAPLLTAALAVSSGTIQAGQSVTFTATPGGGTAPYTVSISCGDGTTLTAAGAHSYAAAGNYTALLTVTDSKGVKAYSSVPVVVSALPVPPTYTQEVTLNVNGADYTIAVDNRWTLLDVIRDKLNLTGTKMMCDRGECGSCTVLIGGKPMLSCMLLAVEAQGEQILTIEGLRTSLNRVGTALHPIQQAFVDNDGTQCGICTPGIIMTTKALLDANPNPTQQQVQDALSGNICRCGCYPEILQSVLAAAKVVS